MVYYITHITEVVAIAHTAKAAEQNISSIYPSTCALRALVFLLRREDVCDLSPPSLYPLSPLACAPVVCVVQVALPCPLISSCSGSLYWPMYIHTRARARATYKLYTSERISFSVDRSDISSLIVVDEILSSLCVDYVTSLEYT